MELIDQRGVRTTDTPLTCRHLESLLIVHAKSTFANGIGEQRLSEGKGGQGRAADPYSPS